MRDRSSHDHRPASSSLGRLRVRTLAATLVTATVAAQFLVTLPASADPFSVTAAPTWQSHAFSPNADTFEDTVDLNYCLSAAANVDITIAHAGGSVVRTPEVGKSHNAGCSSYSWDGKDTGGTLQANGNYDVTIKGTDPTAATSTVILHTAIDNAAVATVTSPTNGQNVSGTIGWTVTPSAGRILTNVYGPNDASIPVNGGASWTGTLNTATLLNGAQTQNWFVAYDDALGGSHNGLPVSRTFTVNNPQAVNPSYDWLPRAFSPNGDGYEDTLPTAYCLNGNATVTVKVFAHNTTTPTIATLDAGTARTAVGGTCNYQALPSASFSWNGKNTAGTTQPTGSYDIVVTATPATGSPGSFTFLTAIDNGAVASVTVPANNAPVSGVTPWTVTPAAGRILSNVYGPADVSTPTEQVNHTWTGDLNTAQFVNGTAALSWQVNYADALGGLHQGLGLTRTVIISNTSSVVPTSYWLSNGPRSFSPNGDGNEDVLQDSYCTSDDAVVTVTAKHHLGATVKTVDPGTAVLAYSGFCGPGGGASGFWSWDGTDDSDTPVAAGLYDVVVSAQPATGPAVTYTYTTSIDLSAVATVTVPTPGASVSGTLNWTVTGNAAHPLSNVTGPFDGVAPVQTGNIWTGQYDTTGLANGPQPLTWYASFTDSFGAQHYSSPLKQNVVVANAETVTPAVYWTDRSFTPNGDFNEDTTSSAYCISNDASVSIIVRHTGGATVANLLTSDPETATPSSSCGLGGVQSGFWEWDGTTNAAVPVPDGLYDVVVTATPAAASPVTFTFHTAVDQGSVGTVLSPTDGSTAAGLVKLALLPSAGRNVTQVDYSFENSANGPTSAFSGSPPDGAWRTTVSAGDLTNGATTLSVWVSWKDTFNQPHSALVVPQNQVTIDNTSIPLAISATPTSGPYALSTSLTISSSDPNHHSLSYTVVWGDGSPNTLGTMLDPYADVVLPHTYNTLGTYTPQVTVTNSSVSSVKTLTINASARPTSTTVACTSNPSVFGAPVSCTATVVATTAPGVPPDHVTFKLDGSDMGVLLLLDASGHATVPLPALTVGNHSVQALYQGGTNYLASSGTVTQVVTKAATTTTISSTANPASSGQSVTFTALVAPVAPGAGTPTGTVQFAVDAVNVGTPVTLSGAAQAVFTTSTLTVGAHTITAAYSGSATFGTSSGSLSETISSVAVSTTTGVTCTPNASVFGQPVSCAITVTATSGTATGTVQVTVDGVASGGPLTLVAGAATFNGSGLGVASHPIVASYTPTGGSNFVASTGSTTQVVNKATTSSTLVCVPNPSVFGQSVTCTTTVTATAPGAGTPTGTVQFAVDGTPSGTPVAIDGTGKATLTRTNLSVASHPVTAAYTGDGRFVASTGLATQVVSKAATSTGVGCTPSPSTYGQTLTCTATVSVTAPGAGTPTGTVNFTVDGVDSGTMAVTGTTASITLATPPAGAHTMGAAYSGDGSFASSSGTVPQTVNKAATTNTVSCLPNPVQSGSTLNCTATLGIVAPGAGTLTGTVQWLVDGTNFGLPVTVVAGQATLATNGLAVGTHSVSAVYSGSTNFLGSTATAVSVVVSSTPVTPTTTTLSCTPSPAASGQTVSCVATVGASSGSPTGTVQFSVDGTSSGSPVAIAAGKATLTTSTLTVGTHPVGAVFTPTLNSGFSGSSGTGSAVINLAATSTTVVCTPSPSVFGQSVSCTATAGVVAPGVGTPTGTFQFAVDTVNSGPPVALNGSQQATVILTNLAAGTRTVAATYSGDAKMATSTLSISQLVNKAATTTTTSCLPNPADTTQSVTCTATVTPVAPGAGQPTGNVQFTLDGAPVGSATAINGSGVATILLGTQAAGAHPVSATYAGDSSFASSSQAITLSVGAVQIPTVTTVNCAPLPSTFGQTVTCTAAVVRTAGGAAPTGSVTFTVAGTTGSAVALDGTGHATLISSTFAVGAHPISATYAPAGGTTFTASNGSTIQNVNKAATSTTLGCSPSPAVSGQLVTCTATVSTTSPAGPPSGTVSFTVDGAPGPVVAVGAGGVATFTSSTLTVGTHPVSAAYSGDGNFLSSTGGPVNQVVNAAATTTTLSCTPNPSSINVLVTCLATVSPTAPGAGTPTGLLTFTVDGVAGSPVALNGAGQATFTSSTLAIGSHPISAGYAGDARFNGSTAPTVTQQVNAVPLTPTSTVVSCTPNASVFGQAVVCTATVTATTGTPTGTVQFSVDGNPVGTAVTVAAGKATYTTSALTVGSHPVAASFVSAAGSNFASSAASTTETVNKAKATTAISCSPNPATVGTVVTCVATVTATAPGAGAPTGQLKFLVDGIGVMPFGTLDATGHASFTSSTLAVGAHTIKAAYGGDVRFLASSAQLTENVNPVQFATTTTLVCTPASVTSTQTVTCTATVRSPTGPGTPTGPVQFTNNGVNTGATVALAGGIARLVTTMTYGNHTIVANYLGVAFGAYLPSSSAGAAVHVDTPPIANSDGTTNIGAGARVCVGRPVAGWSAATNCFRYVTTPLVANDTDVDGGTLTPLVTSISFAGGEWSGLFADGSFYYTEGAGTTASQTKVITYRAVDSSGVQSLNTATFTIITHPRPTGANQTHSMKKGQTLCAGTTVSRAPGGATCTLRLAGLLANATGDSALTVDVTQISFASGEWSGAAADGSFVYKAGANAPPSTKVITFFIVDANGGRSLNSYTYTINIVP